MGEEYRVCRLQNNTYYKIQGGQPCTDGQEETGSGKPEGTEVRRPASAAPASPAPAVPGGPETKPVITPAPEKPAQKRPAKRARLPNFSPRRSTW